MIQCYFDDNKKVALRHVTVAAIALDKERDRILLIKRASHVKQCPNKWSLPGGYLDRDERTPEGALRELREETGYEGKIISLFRINDDPDRPGEDTQNIDFIFLVRAGKKIGEGDGEASEARWFELDNIPAKEDFAFDYHENIELYRTHLKDPFELPIIYKF